MYRITALNECDEPIYLYVRGNAIFWTNEADNPFIWIVGNEAEAGDFLQYLYDLELMGKISLPNATDIEEVMR